MATAASKPISAIFEPGAPPPPQLLLVTTQTGSFTYALVPTPIRASREGPTPPPAKSSTPNTPHRNRRRHVPTREPYTKPTDTCITRLRRRPWQLPEHESATEDSDSAGASETSDSDDSDGTWMVSDDHSDEAAKKTPKPSGEVGRPGRGGYNRPKAQDWEAGEFKALKTVPAIEPYKKPTDTTIGRTARVQSFQQQTVHESAAEDSDSTGTSEVSDTDESEDESDAWSGQSHDEKIPKPPGEVGRPGRGGYNLLEALDWKAGDFKALKKYVFRLVDKHLDVSQSYTSQIPNSIRVVRTTALEKFPVLDKYSDCWPVLDVIRMRLKYTSMRSRRKAEQVMLRKAKGHLTVVHICQ